MILSLILPCIWKEDSEDEEEERAPLQGMAAEVALGVRLTQKVVSSKHSWFSPSNFLSSVVLCRVACFLVGGWVSPF